MLDQFRSLFRGGELGYGEWNQQREEPARTIRGSEAPLVAYEKHLSGEVGLGVVPVTLAGTCHFAAIDIDDDDIDHQALYEKVYRRRLPLHVCRSKSGGAHLYLFSKSPLQANTAIVLLRRWSALLGYPKAEIFPKQAAIGGDNVGNWINLPYFAGDRTTRYCVSEKGALSLGEFLQRTTYYEHGVTVVDEGDIQASGHAQLPPCLAALGQVKLKEGHGRNTVLFNTAVFYRKSSPADWEARVQQHNANHFNPPLNTRELQTVVRSAGRTKYQYTCEQSPLRDYCDRATCETLQFGVNNKPWQEPNAYDDLAISGLRKLVANPPRYIVSVNGRDLEVGAEEFLNFQKFRAAVYHQLDLMAQPMKQPQWEQLIRELTMTKENIDMPEDASLEGLVLQRFDEFLSLRERTTGKEDILRGLPVVHNDQILFRISDFKRHLQIFKLDKLEGTELFQLLKKRAATHAKVRISGKVISVWQVPLATANDQTEDFALPEFDPPDEPF